MTTKDQIFLFYVFLIDGFFSLNHCMSLSKLYESYEKKLVKSIRQKHFFIYFDGKLLFS